MPHPLRETTNLKSTQERYPPLTKQLPSNTVEVPNILSVINNFNTGQVKTHCQLFCPYQNLLCMFMLRACVTILDFNDASWFQVLILKRQYLIQLYNMWSTQYQIVCTFKCYNYPICTYFIQTKILL